MSFEVLIFWGYGLFVWPAFIFTFFSFYFLYIKTKKELKKQETKFLREFKHLQTLRAASDKNKEVVKKALYSDPSF